MTEDWRESAACAQTDPDHFFADSREIGKGPATTQTKAAIKVCGGCEVAAECLDYALANRIREGVWGGISARGRSGLAA